MPYGLAHVPSKRPNLKASLQSTTLLPCWEPKAGLKVIFFSRRGSKWVHGPIQATHKWQATLPDKFRCFSRKNQRQIWMSPTEEEDDDKFVCGKKIVSPILSCIESSGWMLRFECITAASSYKLNGFIRGFLNFIRLPYWKISTVPGDAWLVPRVLVHWMIPKIWFLKIWFRKHNSISPNIYVHICHEIN